MDQESKIIEGFNDLYEIYPDGQVKNRKHNKIVNPRIGIRGVKVVQLFDGIEPRTRSVKKLIKTYFENKKN